MPSRQFKHRSRSIQRTLLARWRALLTLCLILALESLYHVRSLLTESPAQPVDAPFHTTCQEPDVDAARANATIVMLARNGDLDGAVTAVRSLEKQFNRLYHYPITFLNDAPWSQTFIDALTAASSGAATFSTIDARAWGFPAWIDRAKAGREMQAQKAAGLMYADKASYHHMCRFNSGFFYDHPALRGYRWYWRVEPDVRYTCAITYDPFVEMERRGKRYGYAIALWEEGRTAPSLYRKVADWKAERRIATTSLWAALVDPSTAPWPLRKMLSFSRNRDAEGDLWNMCHFWSNFEIADMEFFRSKEYREFFDFLDADGGFYYERVRKTLLRYFSFYPSFVLRVPLCHFAFALPNLATGKPCINEHTVGRRACSLPGSSVVLVTSGNPSLL